MPNLSCKKQLYNFNKSQLWITLQQVAAIICEKELPVYSLLLFKKKIIWLKRQKRKKCDVTVKFTWLSDTRIYLYVCQTATYATSVRLETRKSVGSMSVYHYFSDRSSDDAVYPLHPLPFVVSVDLPHYGKSKCTCCTAQMTPRIKEIPMIAMVFSKERALGLSVQYKYASHNSFLLSWEINVEG